MRTQVMAVKAQGPKSNAKARNPKVKAWARTSQQQKAASSMQGRQGGVAAISPADGSVTTTGTVAATLQHEDHGCVYMMS